MLSRYLYSIPLIMFIFININRFFALPLFFLSKITRSIVLNTGELFI